jgi:subtilase family serine protease/photosystem II stability/assembly factor-like uncharacterized protein
MSRHIRRIPIYITIGILLISSHVVVAKDHVWQWQNPLPQGNHLYALWAISEIQFFAAGASGTLIQYDDTKWSEYNLETLQNIKAIWAENSNHIVAVGDAGHILHYYDSQWHTLSHLSQYPLNAIWATNPNDIYAFGDAGTILHFQNNNWTSHNPLTAARLVDAIGIFDQIYVVGTSGTLLHFDGDQWNQSTIQPQVDFTCVWGNSNQKIFAGGIYFDEHWRLRSCIYQYNGNQWKKQFDFPSGVIIQDIWGDKNDRVLAVSEQGHVFQLQNEQWMQVFDTNGQGLYRLIDTTNGFISVGENGQIIRENNSNWVNLSEGQRPSSINDIWGDENQMFAVCHDGIILSRGYHSWQVNSQPISNHLFGISGNDHHIFVVGQSGYIASYNEGHFQKNESPTNSDLLDICVIGDTAIAVGERGIVLHYSNNTWLVKESSVSKNLRSVWAYSTELAFAVGKDGTIITYDGNSWTNISSPTSERLYSIWGSDPDNIYAAGRNGIMLHYDGQQWKEMSNFPSANQIAHIWGNANHIYAVGNNGTICLFNGENWELQSPPCISDLNTIWGRSESDIFIAGDNGAILHYPYEVPKKISLQLPEETQENQGTLTCYIEISQSSEDPLTIQLQTNQPDNLTIPPTVSIPSGHTIVFFDISVLDNTIHDGEKSIHIEAQANGYIPAIETLLIKDNESDRGIWVTGHYPKDNIPAPIDHIDIMLNREIIKDSFTSDDITITGPSGNISLQSQPEWIDQTTIRFSVLAEKIGVYTICVGPDILGMNDTGMDQDGDDQFGEIVDDVYTGIFRLEDHSGPYIIARSPGEKINGVISKFTIEFNEPLLAESFTIQDIKVIDTLGQIVVIQKIESLPNNRFDIFPEHQLVSGNYQLTIGPELLDLHGNLMNQDLDSINGESGDDRFTCRFAIDQQGPRILFHSVFGKQNEAIRFFDLTFNESILQSSFVTESIEINGPDITVPVQEIVQQATDVYRVYISPQMMDGTFLVHIKPQITDLAGNLMDQNQNGTCGEETDAFELNMIQELPDLEINYIDHAPEAQPGKTIDIKWYVQNSGTGTTTGTWQDSIYLSKDNIAGNDIEVAQVSNTLNLSSGQQYFRSISIDVPDEINTHHWVIIKINALNTQDENNFDNNMSISAYPFWNTQRAYPDLIVSDIFTPQTIFIAETTTISWQVNNQGNGPTSATHWMDHVFISSDTHLDDQDFHVTTVRNADFLASNETYLQEIDIKLPNTMFEKDCYLIVNTDALDQVEEFDKESNNFKYHTIPISVRIPEPGQLTFTNFSVPSEASPGASIQLTWTVKNVGQATLNTSHQMILLSQNKTLEPDKDAILLWISGESYLPGQSYTTTYTIQMPPLIEMGQYYLIPATDLSSTGASLKNEAAPIYISTSLFPDLIVQEQIDFPETLKTNQLLTISWSVANNGNGKTLISNWLDYVYLSLDNILDPSDTYIGNIRHDHPLDALTGQIQLSKTFKIPEQLNGSYFLIIQTDALQAIKESDENNNHTVSQQTILIQHMNTDLSVKSATVPYSAITGRPTNIEWSVQNTGSDSTIADQWIDRIYLSADQQLNDNDILFGEYTHSSVLEANSNADLQITSTIPSLMDGHYYIIIQLDAFDNVYESSSENNNTLVVSEPIRIYHLFPDVEIMNAACSITAFAGEPVVIEYTLMNHGPTETYGIWKDVFYLSDDNHFDPDHDLPIGEVLHESQIASTSQIVIKTSEQIVLPSQHSGSYTIFIQTDAFNQLYEYQGENNNTYMLQASVWIQDSPSDLQVISVYAPENALAGSAIHVSWNVQNKGRQSTQDAFWYDRVYLSKDNHFSPQYDILMGNIFHNNILRPNEIYTCSHYFILRQDLGGTYYIFVQTDADNHVYENTNENNNITIGNSDIQLTGLYVDLMLSEININDSLNSGQSVDISWKVKNTGFDPTQVSSWEDIIYLSKDTIPDIDDTILGVYQHNGVLESDDVYVKTKTIHLPKDFNGNYYLIVHTDANAFNDVFEYLAEDNNYASKAVVINVSPTPNLVINQIDVPEKAWSGQYISVGWTVSNESDIPARAVSGFWYDSVYLSRDPFLDIIHDISIGNFKYEGYLSGHSDAYTQLMKTMLPPGISGPYYVIIHTDSSIPNHLVETNRQDNIIISSKMVDIQLTPPADLVVSDLTIPNDAKPGQIINWMYQVTNQGEQSAVGSWYDTLYLSTDTQWDIDDKRITRFYQNGNLSTGTFYAANITAEVPPVIPGFYYVIVRSDILNDVRETNEDNNVFISNTTIQIDNTLLEKNAVIEDFISRQEFLYYQLTTKQAEDIRIHLTGEAADCAQIFMASDFIPGRSQYDVRGELLSDSHTLMLDMIGFDAGDYYISLYGNTCTDQTPFTISLEYLINLRIYNLSINKGANKGTTTLHIEGANFSPDIQVRLAYEGNLFECVDDINVQNSGNVTVTLDLKDLNEGMYDIVLENPDGEKAQTAFEVVNENRGELFARLLIPGYVIQNKTYYFTLEYGNIGHTDILAPLMVISTGEGGLIRKDSTDEFLTTPIQILATSDRYPVDVLPPQSFFTIQFEFKLTTDEYVPFYIQVMDQPEEPIDWEGLQTKLRPPQMEDQLWNVLWERFQSNMGVTWGDYVNRLRKNALAEADFGLTIRDVQTLLPPISDSRNHIMMPLPIPPGTRRTSGGSVAPESENGQDKLTSIGTGTLHHILYDRTIEYTIRFENKSNAGASAQYIQICDPLNAHLMTDSFELKEIVIGKHRIQIPEGHSYYHTRLDLRDYNQNLLLDIEAGLDPATNVARWIFTAIDPDTGEPSEDPLNGFLPPNITDGQGEGYVRFKVMPGQDIESGTIISNMATIIFDRNEPVDTPIAYNTIDLNVPESHIQSVSGSDQLEIEVKWSGQDSTDGSGIASYDVYVSDNGLPYDVWLSQTTATSGIFMGEPGHEYSFYSIATDKVGNIETTPQHADAVVKLSNFPPVANAGEDQTVNRLDMVTLDGFLSNDPDHQIVSYFWQQTQGQPVILSNPTGISTTFQAPNIIGSSLSLSFALSVTDVGGLSHEDTCTILVVDNQPPLQPILNTPVDGALDIAPAPVLQSMPFDDLDVNSIHSKTRWQISQTSDFSNPVFDVVSSIFLTELPVPECILAENTAYFWRVRFYDQYSSVSIFSDTMTFTTTLSQQPVIDDQTLDLDANDVFDINQSNIQLIQMISENGYMAVQSQSETVSIVNVRPVDPDNMPGIGNRPVEIPFGFISFNASCPKGAQIEVSIYFSEPLPSNARWFKFDYNTGFEDFSSHTKYLPSKNQIILTLEDGGFGDADGIANGVIVDPGGIGIAPETLPALKTTDSSSSCFVETCSVSMGTIFKRIACKLNLSRYFWR